MKLDVELHRRKNQFHVSNQVRGKKVFRVSVGPKEELWSLVDFENKFEEGIEWKRMREDVWVVPTMNLPSLLPNKENPDGRLTPAQTTDDMRNYLLHEFENNCQKVTEKVSARERKKTEKWRLEEKIKKEAIKLTEADPMTPLYKERLGDNAEIRIMQVLRGALTGVPSLVLRGVKTFHDFPDTLEKAGIELTERAENDIIVLVPSNETLSVRYIEVKRQVIMPWEEGREKKVHEQLVKKMYTQLQKDISSFYDLLVGKRQLLQVS